MFVWNNIQLSLTFPDTSNCLYGMYNWMSIPDQEVGISEAPLYTAVMFQNHLNEPSKLVSTI